MSCETSRAKLLHYSEVYFCDLPSIRNNSETPLDLSAIVADEKESDDIVRHDSIFEIDAKMSFGLTLRFADT